MLDSIFGLVETAINFLGEDQFWGLLATGVAALWAWGQRKMGVERKQGELKSEALGFLEAGVAKTYQAYVKARKSASEDGHLTEDEKREARELAFVYAKDYAMKEGVNLVKTLGADMIPVLIEKAVGGLKKEAGGAVGVTSTGNGTTNGAVKPSVQPTVASTVTPTVDGYGSTT